MTAFRKFTGNSWQWIALWFGCWICLYQASTALAQAEAPANPAATRQFAAAAAMQNRELYDLAAAEWKKFLEKFPDDSRVDAAQHYLGSCYMRAKKFPEAIATLELVIKNYPKFIKLDETYLNLGVTYYTLGRAGQAEAYDKAAAAFHSLAEKFPKSESAPQALYYEGESYYSNGKKDKAVEAYARFAQQYAESPLLVDALYALGATQEELGQRDDAAKTYELFLKKFPQNNLVAEVQVRRAEVFVSHKDYAAARPLFAAAAGAKEYALADFALLREAECFQLEKKLTEAAALFDSLPEKFPQSKHASQALLSAGNCFYLEAKYPEARLRFQKVLAAQTAEAAEAAHWMARSWLKQTPPVAQEAFNATELGLKLPAVAESPFLVQLKMDQADALFEIPGRRAAALAAYQQLAKNHPDDALAADALYMAGFSALQEKQYQAALDQADAFRKKYTDHRLSPDVLYVAAESNLQLKNFAAGESLYKELQTKYPDHPVARQGIVREGLSLYLQKKYPEAIAALKKQLQTKGDAETTAEAQHLMGCCYFDQQQYESALESLDAALATKADWRQADETLLLTGRALAFLKKPADARARYETLLKNFPQSLHLAEAHYRLAELLFAAAEYPASIQQYEAALKQPEGPFTAYALNGLGWAQINQGQPQASIALFSQLLGKFPTHEVANRSRYARASAYHQLKKYDEAMADLAEMFKNKPGQREMSDALYLLALCQEAKQQLPAAEKSLVDLLAADPEYPHGDRVYYELGWVRLSQPQRRQDAVEAFASLAEKFP